MPVAVLAGASGFVGSALIRALTHEGYALRLIGRNGPVRWSDDAAVRAAVDGADLLVNLAGKNVNCRLTDANRAEILRSRLTTTRALREAVQDAAHPPAVWLNASTATIYRYALDRAQTESTGELDGGFSPDVARLWEAELFAGELPRTRRVAMRISIALGDGPATDLLFRLARLGAGGPQLDGRWFPHRRYRGIGPHPTAQPFSWWPSHGGQKFSWIHIDDLIAAMRFIRDTPSLEGPVNVTAPHPVDNRALMRALRDVVGVPVGLPAPRFVLEPAMWALRTEPELVLKSRWVLPEKLTEAGFRFTCPELEPALRAVAEH
jgi:NAD dependent epimerase/dehydratase family enzyme